ncbi:UNVERIFIED_CONTAM: hypothetical protein PYX00_011143 [Menopon gallinae]|uniref:Inorganic pyrophosphatase n=1 Tax=Menopon gallinae TaxID=328185 RepID=A0AAW2H655_9NEOP
MVEGVVLVVDAKEGPMPQTRFVTAKALELGLKPIVVINKMDREDKRPSEVINEIFDLFINLDATEEQADFPILYASGVKGWATLEENEVGENIFPLIEAIIKYVPDPKVNAESNFSFLVSLIESDPYVGRILTGKIASGKVKVGDSLKALNIGNELLENAKVTKLMTFKGLQKEEVKEAQSGDIIVLAGFSKATVSDTICSVEVNQSLPSKPIDPPVLAMTFSVNDSPLAGKDGKKLTSRVIRDRLFKEQEGNVSIRIEETENADTFLVKGRGELQLAILIETLRREGFELSIGRPKVIIKEENGKKEEPTELVVVEVDEAFSGTVIEAMQKRKGRLEDMVSRKDNKQKISFIVPTRGLIGYYGKFLTDTKGTGTMARSFYGYEEWKGDLENRYQGVLISMANGAAVAYALFNLEDRGTLFIEPGDAVYTGMIIGEHSKDNDLEVNPLKRKFLMDINKVKIGENAPNEFNVIIEIPCCSLPIKYEIDKDSSSLVVDRIVATPMFYPCNYGFVPQTLGKDGDPLDALVVTEVPLMPGSVIKTRPIGVVVMEDEKGWDEKILCVPVKKVTCLYDNIKSYKDLPELKIKQIIHFFEKYKDLEEGKWVKVSGFEDKEKAIEIITEAIKNYKS